MTTIIDIKNKEGKIIGGRISIDDIPKLKLLNSKCCEKK